MIEDAHWCATCQTYHPIDFRDGNHGRLGVSAPATQKTPVSAASPSRRGYTLPWTPFGSQVGAVGDECDCDTCTEQELARLVAQNGGSL